MRKTLLAVAALPLVALLPSSAPADAPRASFAWPGPPASFVFGPADAPEGGELTVGLLVPAAPPVRLVDLLSDGTMEAFRAAEAGRAPDAPADAERWTALDVPRSAVPDAEDPVLVRTAKRVEQSTRVRVVFRRLLPVDAVGVPVVVLPGNAPRGRTAWSAAAESAGTAILWPRQPSEEEEAWTDRLATACVEAVRSSSCVRRLPRDPLALVSAERHGDEVVVRLRETGRRAGFLNRDDRPVGAVRADGTGEFRFRSPDPGLDPRAHRLVVWWEGEGLRLRRAWRVLDLVGTVERRVLASGVPEAGAPYAPRVLFSNSRTGVPVAGREERLALVRGDRVLAETSGRSDASGGLTAFLEVPESVEPGPAELRVGDDRFPVAVRSGLRVSVVTERSLYRPTDEVQVRAMVHRAGTGRPVAGKEVALELGDVKKSVTTSAFGIASASFRLFEDRAGPKRLRARVEDAEAEAAFAVRAFETPSFTVEASPDRVSARPGESVPLEAVARYVNGTPVVGARVEVEAPSDAPVAGTTDAAGRFAAVLVVSKGPWSSPIRVRVTDADGRAEEAVLAFERSDRHRATVDLVPLEEPVVGEPCRVEVRSEGPGAVTIRVGDDGPLTASLDASGRTVVTVTPREPDAELSVRVGDGVPVGRRLAAVRREPDRLLVRPARRTWAVGETLVADVSGPDGPAFVDLCRDGAALRSFSTLLVEGRASLAVPLGPDLAGPLRLRAWRLREDRAAGSRVDLLVVRARSLRVDASARRDAWRPGETAALDVEVRDRAGRPTAGVLGYWGVDEALLALRAWEPGRETVFDVLSGGSCADTAALAARAEAGDVPPFPDARAALGAVATFDDLEFSVRHRTETARGDEAREAARRAAEARIAVLHDGLRDALRATPIEELRAARTLPEALRRMVLAGRLDPALLEDPWGTPWLLGDTERWITRHDGPNRWWSHTAVPCVSAGPDLLLGTDDDVSVEWNRVLASEIGGPVGRFLAFLIDHQAEIDARWADPAVRDALLARAGPDGDLPFLEAFGAAGGISDAPFEGLSSNGLIGIGGGAGGAFKGRGGSRDLRTGGGGRPGRSDESGETVHLRKDFAPTLCFVPEAIVGPDGRTTLEIPLKDSITTWRLRLVASASDGATGTAETRIRVTQPLHAEPWIATHLTVGDELDLPVAVRNETAADAEVSVRVTTSPEIVCVGASDGELLVAPGGTGALVFRIRAAARGAARVRVDSTSAEAADAVERVVHVRPDAREVVETWNATIGPEKPWRFAPPVLPVSAPADHRLTLYPSPLVDVLGGLEGLLSCPHG